jgi:hypothetical protein
MAQTFCPITFTLLDESISGDKLEFKSIKTGTVYPATIVDTLRATEDNEEFSGVTLSQIMMPYDATNPRIRPPGGCEACKRKVVTYQRLGPEKRIHYACNCGNHWH